MTNAKAGVLMYARQDGWSVDDDFVESVNLSRPESPEITIFIQFSRNGAQVVSAICYHPKFTLSLRDKDKLPTLLTWLRGGWKGTSVPAQTTTDTTASPYQMRTAVDRLYALAEDQVVATWGTGCALRLGPALYRGLLAEQLLRLAAGQDESVKDETIRFMIDGFWDRLISKHPFA
jgi:hypothetical protein